MSEVVNNNDLMETNEGFGEEINELVEFEETSNNGNLGKVLVGIGLTVMGVAGFAIYKCKDGIKAWRTECRKKSLEKDGYVVYKAEEVEVVETTDLEESETE